MTLPAVRKDDGLAGFPAYIKAPKHNLRLTKVVESESKYLVSTHPKTFSPMNSCGLLLPVRSLTHPNLALDSHGLIMKII